MIVGATEELVTQIRRAARGKMMQNGDFKKLKRVDANVVAAGE